MDEHNIFREGFEQGTRSSRRGGNRRKGKGNASTTRSSSNKRNVLMEDAIGHDLGQIGRTGWTLSFLVLESRRTR